MILNHGQSAYINVKHAFGIGEGEVIPEERRHVLMLVRDQEETLNLIRQLMEQAEPGAVGQYGFLPTVQRMAERADKFSKLRNLLGLI